MGRLIKAEIRKILLKKSVLIAWIASLLLGAVLIHNATVAVYVNLKVGHHFS
ncbi:hypothetical protein [Clostridium cochlearium]|uniref:hypothetical protein n=1 Tax=Clostridium cochlearium TaxID=1494 RepID=UPI001EE0DAC9|nr:hypothetical protein [Clostridium cochlearium]MCG4581029.1 hypothetical protein [Clostridium cochlearium]